jgi:CheY-like chemotaxis protein
MAEVAGTARRILICEDDFLVAFTLRENLRHHGYVILPIAANGEEAIALCREHRPEVVLMDLRMPKVSGVEAARAILGECSTCIILISAAPLEELQQALRESGAVGYVRKPITGEELVSSIEGACARWEASASPPCAGL